MIAHVIVNLSLDKAFDYRIRAEHLSEVGIGSQVLVPFGRSTRTGFILSLAEQSAFGALKELLGPVPGKTRIPEKLIELGNWIADYYICSREQAIRALLPGAVRNGRIKPGFERFCRLLDRASAERHVLEHADDARAAGRLRLLKLLLVEDELPYDTALAESDATPSMLATLLKHEFLEVVKREKDRDIFAESTAIRSEPMEASVEQRAALDAFRLLLDAPDESRVLLLRGVTNSGKTEVYLQAIAAVLARGESAIMLVPEIALTAQTVRRFRARFGDSLSVMHSRLTEAERFDQWHKISRNEVNIVIGARSALFAPFKNLGLIVVDEEHEATYKQSESPRYHARDVAVMRGKLERAVVILGSATPSAESERNVVLKKYRLAEMKQKVEEKLDPVIRVVDQRLAGPPEPGKANYFSRILIEAVRDRLARGEQSILFLNRRGYARVMVCDHCAFEARCADCSVAYTYSRQRETLACHLCGNVLAAPARCPQCGAPDIRYAGVGTEKIEAAAVALFRDARVGRMDSDTMRNPADYERVLDRFRRGELDILIGTQMIAKGLHFPNVTLVGLINADLGLSMPDFRAAERTFQLITQVAGRAGRGDVRGEVILQTHNPENDTIRLAAELDVAGFSAFDLEFREMLDYPPFSHLLLVHFRGPDEADVVAEATRYAEELRPFCCDRIRMTGPEPAPIERIKGKFRYLIMLRGQAFGQLRRRLRELVLHKEKSNTVEVYADVDALSLL